MGQELFCINSLEICSNFTFFCLAAGVFQMCNARCFHMWGRVGIGPCHFDGNYFDSVKADCNVRTKNSRRGFKTMCAAVCCETCIPFLLNTESRPSVEELVASNGKKPYGEQF